MRRWVIALIALITAVAIIYLGTFALIYLSQPIEGYINIKHLSIPKENSELEKAITHITYPEIMEAINSGEKYFSMDITIEDYKKISALLRKGRYVEINGSYYKISSSAFVGVKEINESFKSSIPQQMLQQTPQQTPQRIPKLNETELKKYRPLNLSIYYWQLDNEVERTRGYRENDAYTAAATLEEIKAVEELINAKGEIFRFDNATFQIFLKARLRYEFYLNPNECVPAEKVEEFPLLEKGLKEAEKEFKRLEAGGANETRKEGKISVEIGEVRVKMSVKDMDRIFTELGSHVRSCVKYNGSLYSLTFAKPMG